jgi:hypothetical protein
VANAERAAGNRVHGRAIWRAVIGEHSLDLDAVALEELDRAAQEADGGRRLLVVEDLGVGQARGVVDGDVDELPAGQTALPASGITNPPDGVPAHVITADPVPGAANDAAKLLDIDVDQLARTLTLITLGRLQSESAKLAQPRSRQDPRNG